MTLSLIPAYTLKEGLELLSYFLLGFLVVRTASRRIQIRRIYYVLVAMGVFEAFYGMFELFNKNPRILFYKKTYGLDAVTGTFVNRDHLSGYLEMIIPLALGLVISRLSLFFWKGMSWREKLFRLSERGLTTHLIIGLGIISMSLAILFSRSRSGVFLLMFAFLLFFVLAVLYFKDRTRRKGLVKKFLAIVFVAVILISLSAGLESTIERFELNTILREQRLVFWTNTIEIFAEYPLFGTGLGTFGAVYPDHFEREGRPLYLVHAHNDYLEYLFELGGVGMSLLLGGILILVLMIFRGLKIQRDPEIGGLLLGGIVSVVCLLIHAVTDFNLHIPANMLLFSLVLSLTIALTFYQRGDKA